MTRGLEKALAAVRHDNKTIVMSAAEIETHSVFLAGLGIARQEIDLTINVIHSTLWGRNKSSAKSYAKAERMVNVMRRATSGREAAKA